MGDIPMRLERGTHILMLLLTDGAIDGEMWSAIIIPAMRAARNAGRTNITRDDVLNAMFAPEYTGDLDCGQ